MDDKQDTPYSNREIREKWHDIANDLQAILEQTTKHNGRMTKMERWQAYMTGAFTILTIIVVPILAWALYVLVNINQTVHESVDQALQAYNINVK